MSLSWSEVLEIGTNFRHKLHANPELTWHEENTAQAIRDLLDKFAISWKAFAGTGTVAYLATERKGKAIALRGDIDALPINEQTDVEYKSKIKECMHACGHDGHTATLMTTTIWLKLHEEQLTQPVALIFQPAEEGGHGAKKMIDEGCLKNVGSIYGWHNWPAIEYGKAVCPDGIVMAGNGTFHIKLHGVGGHSSQPELCRDPVLAASAITMALQQIVSRQIAPQKTAVVSVTSIDATSGVTTIPDLAKIEGSIRISNDTMRDEVAESIHNITTSVANAYGVKAEIEFRNRYSATINHPQEAENAREILEKTLGEHWHSPIDVPIMASEDFSYFLKEIPGAFMLVGSNDGVEKHSKPCHNAYYDFNDDLIEPVSKVFIQLVGLEIDF